MTQKELYPGMTKLRHMQLSGSIAMPLGEERVELTDKEKKLGWHFCNNLLIHPVFPEFANCTCEGFDEFRKE